MEKRESRAAKTTSRASQATTSEVKSFKDSETLTTAIHVHKKTWNLLRSVAFHRAQVNGGRASVSKLIEQLVEGHREELEREVK